MKLKRLAALANKLDQKGMFKEADLIDEFIRRAAEGDWPDDGFDDPMMPHDDDDFGDPEEKPLDEEYQRAWEQKAEEDDVFKRMTGVRQHTFKGMLTLAYQLAKGDFLNLQSAVHAAKIILDEAGITYEEIEPAPEVQAPEKSLPENVVPLFPEEK